MMKLITYFLVKQWWNIAVSVFLIVMGYMINEKGILWNFRFNQDESLIVGGVVAALGALLLLGTLVRGYKTVKEQS